MWRLSRILWVAHVITGSWKQKGEAERDKTGKLDDSFHIKGPVEGFALTATHWPSGLGWTRSHGSQRTWILNLQGKGIASWSVEQ